MQIRASYQQKYKAMTKPPKKAKNPSKIGPVASAEAALTIEASSAIDEVNTPV